MSFSLGSLGSYSCCSSSCSCNRAPFSQEEVNLSAEADSSSSEPVTPAAEEIDSSRQDDLESHFPFTPDSDDPLLGSLPLGIEKA